MGLEIRKNRFAKSFENSFFRIFAKELVRVFNELNINGVLIGGGISDSNLTFAPDALLICNTAVIIIDFKKYGGKIKLPEHSFPGVSKTKDLWFNGFWVVNDGETIVKGGVRNNPFQQLEAQTKKLNLLVENNIIPNLSESENYEFKNTSRVICFQLEVDFEGEVDPRYSHSFFVADQRSIIDTIRDIVDIVPNEWNDQITGFKLGQNAFDLFKKEFRADSYDPFAENQMYREQVFSEIEFPIIDESKKEEFVNEEIQNILDTNKDFLVGKEKLLILNSDVTSFSFEVVNGILKEILKIENKSNPIDDDETIEENKIIFLAPTNKNVNDVIRDGAPLQTRSLYGKLYDFENSKIQLLNNSLNEREEFPLLKNKDPKGSIYVIYYSHLVYDFGSIDENSLIKFGSGSLANDLLEYVNLNNSNNRMILVHDPYFYGHHAQTVGSESFLRAKNYNFISVKLKSLPMNTNHSCIQHLVKNIQEKKFNNFNSRRNPNFISLQEEVFKNEFVRLVNDNEINSKNILTREKVVAKDTNKWIRRSRGFNDDTIQTGDVLLIKNRVLVPEDMDPFSLPKFVQNGEIIEVLDVIERIVIKSKTTYNLKDIRISKCRVKLKEYEVERLLYLSETSIDEVEVDKEINKHKQIRLREIVSDYMAQNKILEKDVFVDLKEYQMYLDELKGVEEIEGIFEGEIVETDIIEREKRINKLKSKWKINKRKENYVKNELLKNHKSEYFMITQSANFRYGWAIDLHNAYGYRFLETMLPSFTTPVKNIERFHSFLYSAMSVSDRIVFQTFKGLNPWVGIEVTSSKLEPKNIEAIDDSYMTEIGSGELSQEEIEFRNNNNMESFDPRLSKLGNWILKQFKPEDAITIDKIIHNNYQEEYIFRNSIEIARLQFFYSGKWKVRYPKEIGNTSLGELIKNRLKSVSLEKKSNQEEEYIFDGQSEWNIKEYEKLNQILDIDRIKIIQIEKKGEYHDLLKLKSENGYFLMEFWFNKNCFFTKASIYASLSEISLKITNAINQLKND
jgi:hypothetical protein